MKSNITKMHGQQHIKNCTVGFKILAATVQSLIARAAWLPGSVLLAQPVRFHVLFVDYSPGLLLA